MCSSHTTTGIGWRLCHPKDVGRQLPYQAALAKCVGCLLHCTSLHVVRLCRQPASAVHAASWWPSCKSLPVRQLPAALSPWRRFQVCACSVPACWWHAGGLSLCIIACLVGPVHGSAGGRSGLCSWSSALVMVACHNVGHIVPVCTGHLLV